MADTCVEKYKMIDVFLDKNHYINSYDFVISIMKNKYNNLNVDDLKIEKNLYNKPYFSNLTDFHFNISHSKQFIVCAFSNMPIGIDIEKIGKINNRIIEKYFLDEEKDYIYCLCTNQNYRFYEVWTRKEAYVKWLGSGLYHSFKSFSVIENKNYKKIDFDNYIISIYSELNENISFHKYF